MSTFEELQKSIALSRVERERAAKNVFLLKERLRKLNEQVTKALRSSDEQSNTLGNLKNKINVVQSDLKQAEINLSSVVAEEYRIKIEFESFTDPRSQLKRLSDDFPILLFPVRLETRFKKTTNESGAIQHQLWVRIFPDDCSIDSFDETLTISEVEKATAYWSQVWSIGKTESSSLEKFADDKGRGIWRELMGTLNAGRAYWIKENYKPVNEEDIPLRSSSDELILVIASDSPQNTESVNALRVYWSKIAKAEGKAELIAAAKTELREALGLNDAAAHSLIEASRPHNIDEILKKGNKPSSVQVAFIQMPPEPDVKQSIWSQPAHVSNFPERFVLIGFQNDQSEPVIEEIGNPVPDPLIVGPDPSLDIDAVLETELGEAFAQLTDDEKAERYIDYLTARSETQWLFDFDEAIRIGLGFKIDISSALSERGVDRLFVLGVRMSDSDQEGQARLEQLLKHHQFGDGGLSILPQGTATNNTNEVVSGYSEKEDADTTYENYHRDTEHPDPLNDVTKRDGRWLAELLGIDVEASSLKKVQGYNLTDQCEARAMNTALWSGTLGYFMESMLTPVFSQSHHDFARRFLIDNVSGRGRLPAIRIGDQPYGILPVSTIADMPWLDQVSSAFPREFQVWRRSLKMLHTQLLKIRSSLTPRLDSVAYVGKAGGDMHEQLLHALGLHAGSVEFDQRYAESFQHHYNWLFSMGEWGINFVAIIADIYRSHGIQLLEKHGYEHNQSADPKIPILDKTFFTDALNINKPLIDDRELSENNTIRAYTKSGENYIKWLLDNALNNHTDIRQQNGFLDDKPPNAMLYDMLRHSINLQFANTGLNLYQKADILNFDEARALKIDADFIGIKEKPEQVESKWDLIYRTDKKIAKDGELIVDHISRLVNTGAPDSQTEQSIEPLIEQLKALEHLKDIPTARLERAFVEHLDLCSYRLDAWLLGLINTQLQAMRKRSAKQGIYLGAFGWLESVRSEDKNLQPADIPEDLHAIFSPDGSDPPLTNDSNAGYIHAPSVNQAQTAAVLRNAYISNASKSTPETFKVNLSSERVRAALGIIEGMQQGQSLGALLGYQLERGLHDRNDLQLDVYIYELRKVFSLTSNNMVLTEIRLGRSGDTPSQQQRNEEEETEFAADKAIDKIESRNVVSGVKLLDHIRKTNKPKYPFGFPFGSGPGRLKRGNQQIHNAIDAEVDRIMNIRDAVADLAMAESVHQVTQGNYDRASGSLEAFSKGGYPQTPDVIRTPNNGVNITHRFAIHLPSGVLPAGDESPRAKMEPGVNKWLEGLIPADISKIGCFVTIKAPDYGVTEDEVATKIVTMADLKLSPIDLLYLLDVGQSQNLTGLDQVILHSVYSDESVRQDAEIEIKYTSVFSPAEEMISFFELSPLIENVRKLVISARPLTPSDITLPNEGITGTSEAIIDPARISSARQSILDHINSLEVDVLDPMNLLIDAEDFEVTLGNTNAILAQIDNLLERYVSHLKSLSEFGIEQASFGYVFYRKRAIHNALKTSVADFRNNWLGKITRYETLINEDLPGTPENEQTEVLRKAEWEISTDLTLPGPTLTQLEMKRAAFDNKFAEFELFLTTKHSDFQALLDGYDVLMTGLDEFDNQSLEVDNHQKQIVILTEDVLKQAITLQAAVTQKMEVVQGLVDEATATVDTNRRIRLLSEAAKSIFGEDFKLVPEFNLGTEQGAELQKCINNQEALLGFQTDVKSVRFPTDNWLYGIARVREKLAAWESMAVLAEGFSNGTSISLTPMQLPHQSPDHWLALEYPEDYEIESDKLLYTAYLPNFDPDQPQCGLLVDEWTETIPAKTNTTGLAFHYDRPNSEPVQSMLLATPPKFTGSWEWQDIVKTLHETLDLAKLRALEPDHMDQSDYVKFLPATVAATATRGTTIATNYATPAERVFREE